MHKLSKKSIIIIIIIVSIIIYYFNTKEEKYTIENSINTINTKEENIEENSEIIVYITGAIKNEGIYTMKRDDRVADLIEKAGGVTDEAVLDNINLAYKLEDEMKVRIPKTKEENINDNTSSETYIYRDNSNSKNIMIESKNIKTEKVNINTATRTELETLPGIGSSTALKIIKYRNENGKFKSIEDIKKVNGIGESKYNQIKEMIII